MHYTTVGQGTRAHTHTNTGVHIANVHSLHPNMARARGALQSNTARTLLARARRWAENQAEAHRYLIETTQRVYSVALVSAAQHKSTKARACSSAHVFACWAAEGRSAPLFLIISQRLGPDGLHALHGRLTLARLPQQKGFRHCKTC